MKKRSQYELQPLPVTSSNLIAALSSPNIFLQQFSRKDSITSNYNPMIIKQIRVGVTQEQSALPPSYKDQSFTVLLPFILFSVLRQLHVLYLVLMSGFLMFKYCDAHWEMLIVQISLTIAYIWIEIVCRYSTFKFYTQQHFYNDSELFYWNNQYQQWHTIQEKQIKVGQMIKIKKKSANIMEQSTYAMQNSSKIRVPINLLPVRVASREKQVSIQTFHTDKQEAEVKIPILSNFENFFLTSSYRSEVNLISNKFNDQCLIKYTFSNPISESFQAYVQFLADGTQRKITNADTIPRGAFFLNQQQIVGVALYNLEQKNLSHLKHILGSRNSIATLLQRHLIATILFNFIVAVVLLGINAIITLIVLRTTFVQQFYCYFFNYFSLLSFSMNVVMYIILGLHQMIDSFLIRRKCEVNMNNYIKSVDQFGIANTFVMDQFSFVKKNILQVSNVQINESPEMKQFTEQRILLIIQKSKQIHSKFPKHWLSLTHYYRSRYSRQYAHQKQLIQIKQQKIDINGSIRIAVRIDQQISNSYNNSNSNSNSNPNASIGVNSRHYILRFNDKIIFSVLESITIENQIKFLEKVKESKKNGELILMIQVLEIKQQEPVDVSKLTYELDFKFLSLIKLKFIPQSRAVDFVRYLKNKYNIVIMTSSSHQYFQSILVSAGLKTQRDYMMIFEQTEQTDFQKQLTQKMDQYRKMKYKHQFQYQTQYHQKSQRPYREHKESHVFSDENVGLTSEIISVKTGNNNVNSVNNLRRTFAGSGVQRVEESLKFENLIIVVHSSLIVYLGRPSIRKKLRQLSKISTYIIFYNCSQFQKQLCAASIFKTFPQHIFLSNFAIDSNIFRISNLSISISGHSAQQYTTLTAESYQSLQKFMSKQCATSIQLTTIIIKTSIFKNQCLVWSMLAAVGLVYRFRYAFVGQEYTTYVMYLYNVGFTVLPLGYYLVMRPELVGGAGGEDYRDYKLRYQHLKGVVCGVFVTAFTYAIVPEEMVLQNFLAVMVNCTWMANMYYLVIDDFVSKWKQILIILLQCAISFGSYFLSLLVTTTLPLFTNPLDQPPTPSPTIFYLLIFVLNPILILILFFFLSMHRSIRSKDNRIRKREELKREIKSQMKRENVIARVDRAGGKQMRFRRVEMREI